MPIYEFVCQDCHRKTSFFVRSISEPCDSTCSFCGSTELSRVISNFAYHKSLQTVWEESGEPMLHPSEDYYKDPRNIGRWAEKKFQEMGQEMPAQLKEKIQEAREGELPEPLKDLKGVSPTAAYH
jgi:putative FmdB family regulatory protein